MNEPKADRSGIEPRLAELRESGELERMVLADERLCNAVVSRYLDELAAQEHVPVVRGYCALSALPKPKTLEDAKRIVDGK